MIAEHRSTDGHRQREAEEESECEQPQADRAHSAGNDIEKSESKSMREKEAGIATGPGVADSAKPA